MGFLRKKWLVPVVLVVCLSIAFLATTPASAASVHPSSGVAVTAVHAHMTLDCVHMTASVHHYAVTHGYCPAGTGATSTLSRSKPLGVAPGNCGDSWIYISDGGGGGIAAITFGFDSAYGPAVARNLFISWTNWSWGTSGGFSDRGVIFPPTANYANGQWPWTNDGWVTTSMNGNVTLAWGAVCYINEPSDGANITT